jgi:alpha-L-arabinofuranosidase
LTTKTLYASATRDTKSGDVILKVVNTSAGPTETTLDLKGLTGTAEARATVLTSADPSDENSLQEPSKVAPKTESFAIVGASFARTFPGNSFSVIRVPARTFPIDASGGAR